MSDDRDEELCKELRDLALIFALLFAIVFGACLLAKVVLP